MITSHVLNQVPSKSIPSTLYELWNNWKSDPSNLWPWGLVAYIYNPSNKYGKLSPKERKCIFIRYNEYFKGFMFTSEHEDGMVIELETRDVTFLEGDFPCMGEIDRDLRLNEMIFSIIFF